MAFVIPSIFKAIDAITAPVRQMGNSVRKFIGITESGVARQERLFRRFTPAISEAGKQLLSFASTAAIAGGILATINFSVDKIKAYEKGLASFRTIVSDLSDSEFDKFRKQVTLVAKDTKTSTVDVVESFEKIAGLNAAFAKTAGDLGMVSTAAITLAKASGDELGPSAESLVGIMNQFSLQANQANRTINVLAAGQAAGAASITQTAEAFKNFGSTAAGANLSVEQSVALIQVLGKFSVFGAEAGTKLRGSVLKLQQANVGYRNGVFSVKSALEDVHKKFSQLNTEQKQNAYLNKLFGAENVSTGRILVNNIDLYDQFTQSVTGTSEAQKAAAINTNTLTAKLQQLQDKWVTVITSTDTTTSSLGAAKDAVSFLTDNMEQILFWGSQVIQMFILWKGWILFSKFALEGYNVVVGLSAGLQGTLTVATETSTAAMLANRMGLFLAAAAQVIWQVVTSQALVVQGLYIIATNLLTGKIGLATAAQYAWNIAIAANPVGLIIIAIAALIFLIYQVIKHWDTWGETVAAFMGPLGLVINLIQSFRRNWDMIKKAFAEKGILAGLWAIGKTLLDALLAPLQKILSVASKLPGIGSWAKSGADSIADFRKSMGVSFGDVRDQDGTGYSYNGKSPFAAAFPGTSILPAINPKQEVLSAQMSKSESIQRQDVQISVKDETGKASVTKNTGGLPIKLSSTVSQFGAE